jgi:ketosteroid isomerase-like protein
MSDISREQVERAYAALASGDLNRIALFYSEDLSWVVPGNHPLAGRYRGRAAFLSMMEHAAKLTGGTFRMERQAVMTGDGFSSDVCRNTARRLGTPEDSTSPYDWLDVTVFHLLRWEDGLIVEGHDGLFGDDATAFSQFWSPLRGDGSRWDD